MKQKISKLLRRIKLIYFTDRLVYLYKKNKNKAKNKQFKENNPTVVLPPGNRKMAS